MLQNAFYTGPSRVGSTRALILILANAGISIAIVLFWSGLYRFLGQPLEWATWSPLTIAPTLQEYPFVLIWSLPGFCALAGWIARSNHMHRYAIMICLAPILLLAMILGWFHLAPEAWR